MKIKVKLCVRDYGRKIVNERKRTRFLYAINVLTSFLIFIGSSLSRKARTCRYRKKWETEVQLQVDHPVGIIRLYSSRCCPWRPPCILTYLSSMPGIVVGRTLNSTTQLFQFWILLPLFTLLLLLLIQTTVIGHFRLYRRLKLGKICLCID